MRRRSSAASGARFCDADGRDYLDMSSLAECSNLGHQHPRVVEAIRAQAEKLCFVTTAWGATPRAELADELLQHSGFDGGRVFFTLGGADANEHAVKFARQARGKPDGLVVTRDRSYHGASYAAWPCPATAAPSAAVDPAAFRRQARAAAVCLSLPVRAADDRECGELAAAHDRRCHRSARRGKRGRRADGAERRHQRHRRAGQLLAGLREVTRARDVYLIADEVMSGFGRCGEWFAWQRYGARRGRT